MNPPTQDDLPQVPEHDVGLLEERMGFKSNWRRNMTYAEFSEQMIRDFIPVFKFDTHSVHK
eukprot:CAMPEP_0170542890 /NCGR_PEP_ID=MMETSP0211-20121228/2179_1 /TAXON_ID=311385 /ORGANISM="Pseudokeronopsis sp., Strain OXSARD2" /LENGTH=60 /DNA_ID=CAMNT_0010846101 /DNA_START=850 /DNA_END=1032 /DNA_ORIENTATION=-